MKVIYGIGKVKHALKNVVLAIGVFDGIHRGHQELIKHAVKRAKAIKGQAVVMTFFPHPVKVLHPNSYLPQIISLPYRLKLIEELGVARCVVVRFTKRFADLTPQAFIKKYLIDCIRPKEVIVGEDFHFGRKRDAGLKYFKEVGSRYGFDVSGVKLISKAKEKIGSTYIRRLIAEGKLALAEKLLGRPVSIMGNVIRGEGRGKKLGFPTANIQFKDEVIVPRGVYAIKVIIGKRSFDGMANVGFRPSFKNKNDSENIEVNLFNFKKELYGKEIIVNFLKKIRDEKKFNSQNELIGQLAKDKIRAMLICSKK